MQSHVLSKDLTRMEVKVVIYIFGEDVADVDLASKTLNNRRKMFQAFGASCIPVSSKHHSN